MSFTKLFTASAVFSFTFLEPNSSLAAEQSGQLETKRQSINSLRIQVDLIEKCYEEGNFKEAALLCEPLVAKGNNAAQYYLGLIKEQQGEIEQAKGLLTLAAKQSDPMAQDKLGCIYFGEKNYDLAEKYFKESAPALLISKHNLGYMYKEIGMVNQAIHWFQLAADENMPLAQNSLALLLAEKNDNEGYLKYVKLAADQGLVAAQVNYGSSLLQTGMYKEGVHYLTLAAQQGNPTAIMLLNFRSTLRGEFGLK